MESLYVIVLECFLSAICIFNFGANIGIFVTIFVCAMSALIYKRHYIAIILIPLCLVVRISTIVDNGNHNVGDKVQVSINLAESSGKIIAINGRIPRQNISATIYDLPDGKYDIIGKITKTSSKYGKLTYAIEPEQYREYSENIIKSHMSKKAESFTYDASIDFKNLFVATILGDSSHLDRETKTRFSYTGSAHLLALSGLHVGLVYGIIMKILGKSSIYRTQKLMLALVFITLYFMGVVHSSSLMRAYTMVIVGIVGKLIYENVDILKSLGFSFLLGMFIDPMSIGSISLKFSFYAVFAIVGIFPLLAKLFPENKARPKIYGKLGLALTIQLFLLPIMWCEFGSIPFLCLLTNMVLMPLGSFYISAAFIGLLLEHIKIGFVALPAVEIIYNAFDMVLRCLYTLPYLTLSVTTKPPKMAVDIFYFVTIIIIVLLHHKQDLISYEDNSKRNKHNIRRKKI